MPSIFRELFLRSITVLYILFKTSPEILRENETVIIKTSSADDIFSCSNESDIKDRKSQTYRISSSICTHAQNSWYPLYPRFSLLYTCEIMLRVTNIFKQLKMHMIVLGLQIFCQDWWAEVTHGAKNNGSFSEMMGPSISTTVDIWVVYFTYTLT